MFTKARLRLTFWYVLITMVVSIAFSMVIFTVLSHEVERFSRVQRFRIEHGLRDTQFSFDRSLPLPPIDDMISDPDLVAETKQRIIFMLLALNGLIFITSGGFGYVLSGKTLLPIRKMLDEQSRFISDASHELKTPITAIKSMMEVELRSPAMTVLEAKNALEESIIEINKLQTLTQSLLELAQVDYRETSLPLSDIFLESIISEAKTRVQIMLVQKLIKLSVTGDDVRVKGNADRLIDALVIFLDNAIKYSPKKSTILVHISSMKGYGKIAITDHGIGIATKDVPFVFDRFFRGDVSRSKIEYEGYGLGLSIAKQIIQTHNGYIDVESKKEKGTTMTISIPISKIP